MAGVQKSTKIIFLGVLLTVALVSPLSGESREAWVFLSWTTGGTEEERAYFDSYLPGALAADGWTEAGTMEESDLFIVANLAYDYDLRLQAITVRLHDSITGEEISSNAMGYAVVSDMDQWNNTLIADLMRDIPYYEHIAKGLTWSERLWGRAEDWYWFHLAPRVGGDLRFYLPEEQAASISGTFDLGVQFMVQATPWLGVQVETLFTMDLAPQLKVYNGTLDVLSQVLAFSLMVPVVFMVTFRPDEWLIAPFGGVYIAIPLGEMLLADAHSGKTGGPESSAYGWDPFGIGWTAGIEVGRKVGKGTLFLDIRYMADLGDMVSDKGMESDKKKWDVRRSGFSFSLGYSFALKKKKPKAREALINPHSN